MTAEDELDVRQRIRQFVSDVAVVATGCVGVTADSAAPVDQSASGTWATRAAMPTARQEVAVAALGNHIVVVGGFGPGADAVATVEVYDVAADRWETRAPYPIPIRQMLETIAAMEAIVLSLERDTPAEVRAPA